MKIIIFGPQGSGKGTQAKLLAERLNVPHISAGEHLRNLPQSTPLGKRVHELIDKGNLLPDRMIAKIMKERFGKPDCKNGFISDGYPRTTAQAKLINIKPDYVIYLDISDEEAVRRISNRWQCRKCGAVYGPEAPPKLAGVCSECGGDLYQREDDKPEFVRRRLATFHKETEPLKEYYKKQGVLHVVNGERPIDAIFQEILEILKVK